MGHRTQYYFLSFPCSVSPAPSVVKWLLFVYPRSSWCIHYVNMIYDQPDRAAQHNILSYSLSSYSSNKFPLTKHTLLFLFQDFKSLSVNTGMLLHLCLNKTSNGKLPFKALVCVFSGLVWSQVWKAGDGELGILSPLSVEVNTKSQCASNQHNELERVYSIDFSTLCQNVQSGSGAQRLGLLLYLQSSKANGTKYQVSCKVV